MGRVDTTVFLSTALNTGHIHGRGKTSIILPVLARDEDPQATTQESMFSYVRLSEGGKPRFEGPQGPPLSEVQIIARVFRRVLGDRVAGLDLAAMESHAKIREAIAAVVPGYGSVSQLDRPREERRDLPGGGRGEFLIPGRKFHTPEFRTTSGRAVFHPVPRLRPPPGDGGDGGEGGESELRLMTIRSEGQFNTVVYDEDDFYRGQERRDVILMNRDDIARLGLKPDERVHVKSEAGEMRNVLVREGELPPGNAAMYYPEANALVPRDADKESRTPAFKDVRVRVGRSGELTVLK
jgi:anaerobic selenocysteine-containing dehydrogenase